MLRSHFISLVKCSGIGSVWGIDKELGQLGHVPNPDPYDRSGGKTGRYHYRVKQFNQGSVRCVLGVFHAARNIVLADCIPKDQAMFYGV
jgi:hypothetical protein